MKSRIVIIFAGLIALWLLLLFRAAELQTFPDSRLRSLQERQFQTVVTLQSRRGAVVDRKGRELALSSAADSLYADPKLLENKKPLAKKLAKLLGFSYDNVYAKIKDPNKRFVWIARLLPKEKSAVIKSWDIRGLSLVEEFKRVYPNESLLAHTLGMVGSEGQGLEGLELQYDQQLRGSKKKVAFRRDARGRPLIVDGMMFADNPDGSELRLTVDSEMQHMLEGELEHAVSEFDADQAFGVIMDVQTSAILALVNTPIFDANQATKVSSEVRRNRVVTDTFEPGSTLKTFAIATGLQKKMIAPNTKFNTENGMMRVGDRIIREADAAHSWASLTVSEILEHSSNIGVTKIAFQMGAETLHQGLADFGFGTKSGLDLPGESRGNLLPLPWNQHLLSNISFGQGIAVTPLQVANAYAAIANGGVLNTPFIVQSLRDPDSGELIEAKAKPIRRVLDPSVAESMRLMLMAATSEGGTGTNANVEGFLVGGKTGTAQKVNPNGRGYLPKAYISSFAGFIPAGDPRFVIYIAVDHPKKSSYYGAEVAAPVFSRVASYAVRMEGLAPMLLTEKNLLPSMGYKVSEPVRTIAKKKSVKKVAFLSRKAEARGESTPATIPDAEANLVPSLVTSSEILSPVAAPALAVMPDFKDQSLRQVLRILKNQNLEVKIVGSGSVFETEPSSGAQLSEGQQITIHLK